MTNVPITYGSGQASIAGDTVGSTTYQTIKIADGTVGGTNGLIVNSDGTLNARISGSVATAGGTFTGSVSGTVGASIIGTVPMVQSGTVITSVSGIVNISGSVVAVQGTSPWTIITPNQSVSGTVGASIIGTVPVNIVSGGTTGSVSGTVGASIIGQLPAGTAVLGSIMTLQGTNPWIITGSVQATAAANQSVSGTINVGNFPATQAVSGSVAVLQGTNPFIITGSIQGSFSPSGNQSVSGAVGASILGNVNTTITSIALAGGAIPVTGSFAIGSASVVQQGTWNTSVTQAAGSNPWVMTGSVQGTMSVLGTVPVTQASASNPWIITGSVQGSFSPSANQSVSGTVQTDVRGSVAVVIIGGSIATATTNSSVMLLNSPNVIGSVAALQGTNPWIVTSSIAGGLFPISGSVAATIVGTPNVNTAGSVVAFQGTSPWVINFQNSSIIALQSGSVISINVGSTIAVLQSPSIVGTYAGGGAHAAADKGLYTLGIRNDTLSSVASADTQYTPAAFGPAGEMIIANAPFTKWVQGTADFRQGNTGAAIQILATGGTSVFTYITGVQVANMGSASVLVTLISSGSTLGYTIAPAGGGSNILYPNALKTFSNGNFAASISGIASVLVSAQGFVAKI